METSNPYNRMCAISAMLPAGDSYLEGSTSGILIDAKNGLVLSHASLLYPFVEKFRQESYEQLLNVGYSNQAIVPHQLKIEVFLPNSSYSNKNTSASENCIHPVKVLGQNNQDISPYTKCSAKLKSVFVCSKLQDTLHKLTPRESWQLAGDVSSSASKVESSTDENLSVKKEEMCYQLLPYFVLIKLQNLYVKEPVTLSLRLSDDNRSGDTVEICATPFGTMSPDVFLNSRSRGIISKLAGPNNVLLFTDARCVPGSEGGGVFYCHQRKRTLTAIVIASLCWKANEWVGLSMACGISEVLESLKSNFVHDMDMDKVLNTEYSTGYEYGMVAHLIDSVVYVAVGASWGSGVLLDSNQGVILTCCHVLKGVDYTGACVSNTTTSEDLQCSVLFRAPLKSQFDIAVIKTNDVEEFDKEARQTTFGQAVEGDVVYVIGHAIFRGSGNQNPMVTRGIVSKIVRYNSVPVLMQTTCAVHAGASGGGVFNTKGQLVALVVCNSRDTLSGASYPHVNLCIPMETISSVLTRYLDTNDTSILQLLHVKSKALSRLWSIGSEDSVAHSQL